MLDTAQHKIGRNRSPRVQITYDVEIGDAIEKVEIPFVVGIMADLSGYGLNTDEANAIGLKDRSFVEIDRDNFGDVMAKIAPSAVTTMGALSFASLDDFDPAALASRVDAIDVLQKQRSALRDILTKLDSNDELYKQLKQRVEDGSIKALGTAAATRIEALEKADADKDKDKPAAT